MKKIVFIVLILLFSIAAFTQAGNIPPLDKSPMDMSYYPSNYPVLKIQDKLTEPLVARVIYSRPQKAGRLIFGVGGLVKYGELWRLGANEATEIEFFRSVRIGGKKIPKGRYTLYAIASETSWILIINKDTDTWGAFKYDPKKDITRIQLPVQRNNESLENLSMFFEKSNTGIQLVIGWDVAKVALPITI